MSDNLIRTEITAQLKTTKKSREFTKQTDFLLVRTRTRSDVSKKHVIMSFIFVAPAEPKLVPGLHTELSQHLRARTERPTRRFGPMANHQCVPSPRTLPRTTTTTQNVRGAARPCFLSRRRRC